MFNIPSVASTSDSNSEHMAPPTNDFHSNIEEYFLLGDRRHKSNQWNELTLSLSFLKQEACYR